MKLIDLLVQELPKHCGWPEGAGACAQDNDGEVCFFTGKGIHRRDGWRGWSIPQGCDSTLVKRGVFFIPAEDMMTSVVCHEQYETALAASKQGGWNGDGLPPVGVKCEFFNEDYDCRPSVPDNGTLVEIVAHKKSPAGFEVAIFTWETASGGVHSEACTEMLFRPIRTEAERKREEMVEIIFNWADEEFDLSNEMDRDVCGTLYDAIAAGKIPGVRIE